MNSLLNLWLPRSLLLCTLCVARAGEIRLTILDDATGQPVPARIHLLDQDSKPQRPAGFPYWADHFVCGGTATLNLADGNYTYTVERGPEFNAASGKFEVRAGQTENLSARLRRIVNLAGEGWYGGETHVHRGLQDVELLMRAEDLHVGQVITWWNKTNPWKDAAAPPAVLKKFDDNRFYHTISGEDERDGGALLYCDLPTPLDITAGRQHFPSSLAYAKQARERGARWLDVEKPFWWDFPMWVAHGVADTVGIANNHMYRSGVYEGEAWGRPRDTKKYPPPLGNALWTLQIYYHALNSGVRLPPSAGSASGVLPNPVGYNRAYVYVDGDFTYEKWRDGLLAGRSFVSNGPLLRCRANGDLPGHLFKADAPVEISIDGRLDSREQIKTVELVRNGVAERVTLPHKFTIDTSGWFLLRAIADVTNTFRYASTAPWYAEIANRPAPHKKESAQFFVDWCRERIGLLEKRDELTAEQKEQVIEPWRVAQKFWQAR